MVKELLMNNEGLLEVNTVFGSWLHIAASYGRIDIARYLIECGIDVNRNGDISGGNPIRSAAENGQIDMVEHGIDIAEYYSIGELDKVDACEYAKQLGQTEIEKYLRKELLNDYPGQHRKRIQ